MGRNIKNEIGNRYGRLTVLELIGVTKRGSGKAAAVWKCLCDCGNITEVRQSHLGKMTRSCGCLRKNQLGKRRFKDETGNRYGRLTVLELAEKSRRVIWKCLCDCGKETEVDAGNLRSGSTKSCGCMRKKR